MIRILSVLFISFGFIGYSYAGAICNDGWISKSSGSGTCSWHGGVFEWIDVDIDSFDDDGFYWTDDEFFDPCEKRNRIKGQTRQECEESPFSSFNRFKQIIQNTQNSDDYIDNLKQIIQNTQNSDDYIDNLKQIIQNSNKNE